MHRKAVYEPAEADFTMLEGSDQQTGTCQNLDNSSGSRQSLASFHWRNSIGLVVCWKLVALITLLFGVSAAVSTRGLGSGFLIFMLSPAPAGLLALVGAAYYLHHFLREAHLKHMAFNVQVVWGLATATWAMLSLNLLGALAFCVSVSFIAGQELFQDAMTKDILATAEDHADMPHLPLAADLAELQTARKMIFIAMFSGFLFYLVWLLGFAALSIIVARQAMAIRKLTHQPQLV